MFKIETSTEIRTRRDFARLCNARRLWRAVEVGTDQGRFAKDFLDEWEQGLLFCIDPYQAYPEMGWDREADRSLALQLLSQTTLPLAEIALASGYPDQTTFTRGFTRRFGQPPGAWRAAARSRAA